MPRTLSLLANNTACARALVAAVLAASLACRHPSPPLPPVEEAAPAALQPAVRALEVGLRQPAPGLAALACGPQACAWLGPEGLTVMQPADLAPAAPAITLPFTADHLTADDSGFLAVGFCEQGARCLARLRPAGDGWQLDAAEAIPTPAPPGDDPPPAEPTSGTSAELALWRQILGHERRIPFSRSVPVAGGGVVTYRRALRLGGGVLARVGPGILSVDAPSPGAPVSCEGWLAPHPGGQEIYLVLWPRPELAAYESMRLTQRWALPLPGPAQGLFVDPAGRFALLSETAPASDERLLDHPALPLPEPRPFEPLRGATVLPPDAPLAVATLLVDLGGPALVTRVEGAFRAWQQGPDGAMLLATDQAIQKLTAP